MCTLYLDLLKRLGASFVDCDGALADECSLASFVAGEAMSAVMLSGSGHGGMSLNRW